MCVFLCVSSDKSAAEKRRQLIQESKFLGGDMEHTHLVKGLDFALLQKVGQLSAAMPTPQLTYPAWSNWLWTRLFAFQVRAEITSKEKEEEDMMEKVQKETKYESWLQHSTASVIGVSARADSNVCMFQEGRGSGREDWI